MRRKFRKLKKQLQKRRKDGAFFQQENNEKWYLKNDERLNNACENTTFVFHNNN